MKAILLPGNSLKFPLVKVIVSKIAYKSIITTKNSHFLITDHRNVVPENFFRGLLKSIRVINRTNSWAIWTRISEVIDHFSKRPATPPKKNSHSLKKVQVILWESISNFLIFNHEEKMPICTSMKNQVYAFNRWFCRFSKRLTYENAYLIF